MPYATDMAETPLVEYEYAHGRIINFQTNYAYTLLEILKHIKTNLSYAIIVLSTVFKGGFEESFRAESMKNT